VHPIVQMDRFYKIAHHWHAICKRMSRTPLVDRDQHLLELIRDILAAEDVMPPPIDDVLEQACGHLTGWLHSPPGIQWYRSHLKTYGALCSRCYMGVGLYPQLVCFMYQSTFGTPNEATGETEGLLCHACAFRDAWEYTGLAYEKHHAAKELREEKLLQDAKAHSEKLRKGAQPAYPAYPHGKSDELHHRGRPVVSGGLFSPK
jgi:hypothetical protein